MILTFGTIHEGTRYRVKDREKALIFQEICTNKKATRRKTAEKYGLRPTSVSRAVQEMLDDGLVIEGNSREPGKPGRPELYLEPNYNLFNTISMYIEGRELKGALINLGEEIITESSTYIPRDADNRKFAELMLNLIGNLSLSIPQGSTLIGEAISLVGTVNPVKKIWISSARWNAIQNLDFRNLETEENIKISVKRSLDTELEYLLIKNKELTKKNVLLFHWGFGIGAAYSCRGKILDSTIGRFGEIGHTRVGSLKNKKCLCGAHGCLETEAAIWALVPLLKTRYPKADEDERMFAHLLGKPGIIDLDIIENSVYFTGIGLTNLYKIFYPDIIMFIGPFTENKGLFSKLIGRFEDELPNYARGSVSYRVIMEGFKGVITGNVYNLFRSKLQTLLKARY